MSGELLRVETHCRACRQPITLLEMHYLADEDGTATCCACEWEWCQQISAWRRGEREDMPVKP